jgi:dihydrofolate reductase
LGKLSYSAIMSLDGYVEDQEGKFDWAEPDAEVYRFVNDLERPVRTYLYGRRMYETMVFWETADALPDESPEVYDFARIWQSADKVVFSRTLEAVDSARTRLEREFDAGMVRRLKESSDGDLTVGGAHLAGIAIAAGLVDEYQLFVCPFLVGGGKRALPGGVFSGLHLEEERRFGSGVVFLRYSASSPTVTRLR